MGQAARAFQFDPEFLAFDAPIEQKQSASRELCCVVMFAGDELPTALAEGLGQTKYQFELNHTRSLAEAQEALDQHNPDLILLGSDAGDGDSLAFARKLSADARTCDVPVIVLAQNDAESIAIDVLRAGATDCIPADGLEREEFDQAIENALRRNRRNAADHLAVISNLESENATLRRIALRNMRLLKTEALPLLSFAWQALDAGSQEADEGKRLAQRLSRITRTMMGLIDDTVITSATHKALDVPGPVDLHAIAKRIIADDCGEIRLSSAHFKLNDLPVLFVRESIVAMLFEELFVSMVRNARLGSVSEIEVGCSRDPNGNPIVWVTDSGVPLSARKQALASRYSGLNDLGSPRQDGLSWSLCQRLTEKCGGEFKISQSSSDQTQISLRFPVDLVVAPEDA